MKHCFILLLSLSSFQLLSQVTDITPRTKYGNYFTHLTADSKGNVYTICGGGSRVDVMKYGTNGWTFPSNPTAGSAATGVFIVGDALYATWKKGSLTYISLHEDLNVNSYAFNAGEVLHVSKGTSNHLQVFGKFTDSSGNKFSVMHWEPKWKAVDQSHAIPAIRELLSTSYLHHAVSDDKNNYFVIATTTSKLVNDYIMMHDGRQWKYLMQDTSLRYMDMQVTKNGELYIAAYEKNDDTKAKVLKWANNKLTNITSATPAANGKITSLTVNAASELFTTGDAKDASGNYAIMKWNGAAWNTFSSFKEGPVKSMAYAAGNIYAVADNGAKIYKISPGSNTTTTPTPPVVKATVDVKAREIWNIHRNYMKQLSILLQNFNTAYSNANAAANSNDFVMYVKVAKAAANDLWTVGLTTRSAIRKHVIFRENWFADFLTSNADLLQEYMSAQNTLAEAFINEKPANELAVAKKTVARLKDAFIRNLQELNDAADTYKKRNGF